MNLEKLTTIEALDNFLKSNQIIVYSVLGDKAESYQFIRKTPVKFRYMTFSKRDKGVVRRYLLKLTGYSKQQLTRLIGQYKRTRKIEWQPCWVTLMSLISILMMAPAYVLAADLVIVDAQVYTVNESQRVAQAVVVEDGKIA